MRTLRLALAQINSTVGDLAGNTDRIIDAIGQARAQDADIVSFPELAITGYPPEDLLLKPQFARDNLEQLERIIEASHGITTVVGFVDVEGDIYNAAAVIHDGELAGVYHKQFLPNYGVFDENRYFLAGSRTPVFTINGVGIGVNICEDIWYPTGPTALQCFADAQVIININASPFHLGKVEARNRMIGTRAMDNLAIIAYTNLVGGQDELIFDGHSAVFNEKGQIIAHAAGFQEDLLIVDVDVDAVFRARLHDTRRRQEKLLAHVEESDVEHIHISDAGAARPRADLESRITDENLPLLEQAWRALVLGLRDYVRKNGFAQVVLGLSGGIDSAVCAVLAVDALGPENVIGVRMPSGYSSEGSLVDAQATADALGIRCLTIPIGAMFDATATPLADVMVQAGAHDSVRQFEGVAFENLQARLRGITLMTLSNQFNWLVLTTGNKSEAAAGYSTLYGDSVGAYAPIKDVPKMLVYDLARYRNEREGRALIPQNSIDKAPSAELRPNQTDQDSLPPYPLLDALIQAIVVEDRDIEDLVDSGFDRSLVERFLRMLYGSEFKRRQVAPGTKITPRAFGKDRRWPITHRYRG